MHRIGQIIDWLGAGQTQQRLTGWLFLRLLALIYLAAFLSLSGQLAGLVGPDGILPFDEYLSQAAQQLGQPAAWFQVPSLFWCTGAGELPLQGAALLGSALALVLLFARWERVVLIALFILYLSLYQAGQIFTNFQWDTLLLESGFLAIFLPGGANRLLIFLFEWLLFRLRFMSGLFKLLSGDPSWSGFTALNHYFEAQPLPHVGAWYAQQLPDWLLQSGVGLTFFSELIVPFFIFLPRPFRLAAAAITLLMQLLIIATSNHNFFNLLTIALCLFLLDDRILAPLTPAALKQRILPGKSVSPRKAIPLFLAALLILPASLIGFSGRLLGPSALGSSFVLYEAVSPFGLGHLYHVFPTMQRERQELIVQGSMDGLSWETYTFKYKPGDPGLRPCFIIPHQPRLDWMLWFAPTQQPIHLYWFGRFMQRLHEGSPTVTRLLSLDPFAGHPPRYLRVLVYRYRFSRFEERNNSGDWWQRELLGEFPNLAPRNP